MVSLGRSAARAAPGRSGSWRRGRRTLRPADERAVVEAGVDAFAAQLAALGIPTALVRAMSHWPAHAVVLDVERAFSQTPGPGAGAPLPGGEP